MAESQRGSHWTQTLPKFQDPLWILAVPKWIPRYKTFMFLQSNLVQTTLYSSLVNQTRFLPSVAFV